MTQTLWRIGVSIVTLGLLLGPARPTQAALILTMEEVAGDVVFSASGRVNLAALFLQPGGLFLSTFMIPSEAIAYLGADPGLLEVDTYRGISGPASFGPRTLFVSSTSGSGDRLGLHGSGFNLTVPAGYVSGEPLSATNIFDSATFANLGVTSGTYVWTWGSGSTADSLTLRIVPEPASLSLIAIGMAGLGVRRLRRGAA